MEQQHLSQQETPPSLKGLEPPVHPHNLTNEGPTGTDLLFEQTTSADTANLMALLQQEARLRRKDNLAVFAWSGTLMLSMLWIVNHFGTDWPALQTELLLCFGLLITLGMGMCVQISRRSYRRRRALTHALTRNHDVQQVGPLIQTLRVDNTPVRNLAKQALIDLLPTLQASDAALLGDSERAILLRQLAISPNDTGYRDLTELFSRSAYRREIDFRQAILKALEQVGGAKELSTVDRLARGLPSVLSASRIPNEVREAARQCLPYLQARAGEQRASEQLLRASDAHATPHEMLLRPAITQPDAAPEQLLRAGDVGS